MARINPSKKKCKSKKKKTKNPTSKPKNFKRCIKEPKEFALIDDKPIYELGGFIGHDQFQKFKENFTKYQKRPKPKGMMYKCHLFGLGNVLKLLHQPGCHGMRVYYGMDEKNRPQLMLVGVYQDGNDMLDHTLILDASFPCPDYCDDNE